MRSCAEEHDEVTAVAARGYWEGVWSGFRRDKLALAGAVFIVFLFFVAFVGAPIAQHILGHGPNDINPIPARAAASPTSSCRSGRGHG